MGRSVVKILETEANLYYYLQSVPPGSGCTPCTGRASSSRSSWGRGRWYNVDGSGWHNNNNHRTTTPQWASQVKNNLLQYCLCRIVEEVRPVLQMLINLSECLTERKTCSLWALGPFHLKEITLDYKGTVRTVRSPHLAANVSDNLHFNAGDQTRVDCFVRPAGEISVWDL